MANNCCFEFINKYIYVNIRRGGPQGELGRASCVCEDRGVLLLTRGGVLYGLGAKSRRSISRAMRMAVEASLPAGMEIVGRWGEVDVMTTW